MWLEIKYINLLQSSLEHFKAKGNNIWNFRCYFCNDSKNSKTKSRGYFLERRGQFFYYCHNCSCSYSFKNALKLINPFLYDQYIHEKYSDSKQQEQLIPVEKQKTIPKLDIFKPLIKLSNLSSNHTCKKYAVSRQIPSTYHYKLFYCDNFKHWTNSLIKNKFDIKRNDEARLVIPLFNKDGACFGYQGRALAESKVKYITIILDEDKPRIFGLDTVNLNRQFYCFEGPIDSMFINNSIASCGGKIQQELQKLNFEKNNCTIVYDNEKRNKDTIEKMLQATRNGYKICIWPNDIQEKDINEMILKKVSGQYCKTELALKAGEIIRDIIDKNTYKGLEAELKIKEWSRINV